MIRAVVVEDEPRARQYLVALLRRTGRVEVIGEAEDAVGGLVLCQRSGVDVAFLDVRLPGPDGLTLAAMVSRLPEPPLLVIVTGHAEYAVEAFRVRAADYLLKPLEPAQVEETVLHLEQRLRERRGVREGAAESELDRLPVRDRDSDLARLLTRQEIVAVLRRGRRTWIHTVDAEYPSYSPVSRVEEWLGGPPFLRAARDAVVNLVFVEEILHYGDRLYRLQLSDRPRTVVEVSRSAAPEIAALLKTRF